MIMNRKPRVSDYVPEERPTPIPSASAGSRPSCRQELLWLAGLALIALLVILALYAFQPSKRIEDKMETINITLIIEEQPDGSYKCVIDDWFNDAGYGDTVSDAIEDAVSMNQNRIVLDHTFDTQDEWCIKPN